MQLKPVENVFECEINGWEIAKSLFSVNSMIVQHKFKQYLKRTNELINNRFAVSDRIWDTFNNKPFTEMNFMKKHIVYNLTHLFYNLCIDNTIFFII